MKKKIEREIVDWIDGNRKILPLNSEYWKIHISGKTKQTMTKKTLAFGKYTATDLLIETFYKSISRTIKLAENE